MVDPALPTKHPEHKVPREPTVSTMRGQLFQQAARVGAFFDAEQHARRGHACRVDTMLLGRGQVL